MPLSNASYSYYVWSLLGLSHYKKNVWFLETPGGRLLRNNSWEIPRENPGEAPNRTPTAVSGAIPGRI